MATARRSSISEPHCPRACPGPVRPIAHTRGVARTAATCRRPPAWTRRDCHTPLSCCAP
jgi:hypothetical protein